MERFTNLLSTLLHRLQSQCVSRMKVTPSPERHSVSTRWQTPLKFVAVLIASAVRLDLAASHSGSWPAAIATAVRLTSGLTFVQAEFCIRPVCLAPGLRLFCSCSASDPTAGAPWPFHCDVEVNGDAAPRPRPPPGHPATDRRTDGRAH